MARHPSESCRLDLLTWEEKPISARDQSSGACFRRSKGGLKISIRLPVGFLSQKLNAQADLEEELLIQLLLE